LLARLTPRPDVVLQAGALFSPGLPPRLPYVLFCDYTGALALRAARETGAPWTPNLGGPWREREVRVYRGAAAIATFSRRVAGSLVEDYGVDVRRVAVVGAGANVFPDALPERRDDGRTILFVGKDFERKGGPELAAALALVRRRVPGARLVVAGPRERPPLPDGATFVGRVPLAQLPSLCAEASVFAMPTLREPYGLAFLDAMACGLPCVGTATEAVPEIVDEGRTGLLVPPGDVDALAGALVRLLSEPERAREMGRLGREKVARHLRWEHVAERVEGLCRSIAGAGPARDRRPFPPMTPWLVPV
jgi:glycosyltransferase involved in cell wall biosynthesis